MPATDRRPGQAQPEYLKKIAYNVFELGHGYKTCAAVLDVSVYTVREWYAQYKLGHYDADFMESKPKRKSYSVDFRQKVIKDYVESQSTISDIARRHEISKRTARRWIEDFEKEQANATTK